MENGTSTPCFDPDYAALMAQIESSRMSKAGLRGPYRNADSERGREVFSLAKAGRGAYLWGEPGTGKTYAASCAVRLAVEESIGNGDSWRHESARIVQVAGMLDELRDAYDGGDKGLMRRLCRIPLLALDDLGAERPTEWAMERLTALIDERTSRELPTVITSNYRLGELRDIWGGMQGKRIASRIAGACEVIEVSGKDRRLA